MSEGATIMEALTAEDFDMVYDAERTFPFTESEDATIMAYGHVDPETLAKQVTEYDKYVDPKWAFPTDASDVNHFWAVTVESGDGWRISWNGITSETPGAFPVSVVYR